MTKCAVSIILMLLLGAFPTVGQATDHDDDENKLIPINPQESNFFDYLNQVGAIRFADNLPTEPWFECVEGKTTQTFFSASLYSFTSNRNREENVEAFVATLMDHAYWSKIGFAHCRYDIDHFNVCKAQGRFTIHFKNQRIIYFHQGAEKKYCSGN